MSQDGQETEPTEEESEELKRFRQQWKEEVQRKRHRSTTPPPTASDSKLPTESPVNPSSDAFRPVRPFAPYAPYIAPASVPPNSTFVSNGNLQSRRNALDVYRQAVKCEQASELDEALRLYRQAFRMDPDVDRVYHKAETQAALAMMSPVAGTSAALPGHKKTSSVDRGVEAITHDVKVIKPSSSHAQPIDRSATGTLARLLKDFPAALKFEPEDEMAPTPIEMLPDELLVHVIRYLGTSAIERFGTVSRKARVLSLDSTIWRSMVEAIYKPPQIPEDELLGEVVDKFGADYRRVYIEQPRVRLDGVYIAVCHYVREGHSENAWVNISHLITYHRYLRFYPNGQVISLLANEEHEPQHVITVLRPTLRMKGFFIGIWRLVGTTVYITNLLDPADSSARYSFQMTLNLRSRPLGRWNRLDFQEYDSVNIETGEAVPFALKNERSFWFSMVRSYSVKAE